MEFKTVFFAMTLTLVSLFIFSSFYRKKEKQITKLEAAYYEKLLASRKTPQDSKLVEELKQAAHLFGRARGLEDATIQQMIVQDLKK